MLEKPDIQDSAIVECLREHYGIDATQLDFLPLGADYGTAVYRAVVENGRHYFVKLRRDPFNEMTVIMPQLMFNHSIRQIVSPELAEAGKLWVRLGAFNLIVYPYIDGQNGFEHGLAHFHWIELGRTLRALHSSEFPASIRRRMQQEEFSDLWREQVKGFMRRVEAEAFADPVAAELADFLNSQRETVNKLVNGAEEYAAYMQTKSLPFVLCHADIHGWNVLIDKSGDLYIVDWDTLIFAPKERDLMFIGSGLFPVTRSLHEDSALFYEGYGVAEVDPIALAYYRYERIVQDIAAYCEEILLTEGESEDRENGLRQLTGQFEPGQVIDIAFGSAPA